MSKTINANISQRQIKEMARSIKDSLTIGYYVDLFIYPDGDWKISEPNTGVYYPDTDACVLQFKPLLAEDSKPRLSDLCHRIESFIEKNGEDSEPLNVPWEFICEVRDSVLQLNPSAIEKWQDTVDLYDKIIRFLKENLFSGEVTARSVAEAFVQSLPSH